MATITINGNELKVKKGTTLLEACQNVGVKIPTLCFLKEINEIGYCRVCVVDVKGEPDLVTACNTEIKSGMIIETDSDKVIDSRVSTLQLLAKKHRFDCWKCPKEGQCEFYNLLKKYRVDFEEIGPSVGRHNNVVFGEGISQDQSKCVLCKRCVAVCNNIVTAKVFKFRDDEGIDPIVSPTPGLNFAEAGCVFCGQCVKECPTGTLYETDHIVRVEKALKDPNKFVVVQPAPAVRVAIGEEFGYPIGTPVREVQGKMYRAFKELGFDNITDVNWAADLTILEEGTEFIGRVKDGGTLPMFTSCSPGWIRYIEQYRPEYLDNLSTTKSPHMMQGSLIKNYYAPQKLNKKPEDIYVVSIMPCTAKKYEIDRPELEEDGIRNVDAVLTTRELARMIKRNGIDFRNLEDYIPESSLVVFSGAGTIFGASGGVMEAALRTVYETLEGKELEKIEFEDVRGFDASHGEAIIKEATIKVTGTDVNVAVVHGGAAIKKMFEILDEGKKQYHFIEFMGCPGGCVNGGGQPIVKSSVMDRFEVAKLRADALYDQDAMDTPIRKSHNNPTVAMCYEEFLGEPNSEIAHKYCHTHYSKKEYTKE